MASHSGSPGQAGPRTVIRVYVSAEEKRRIQAEAKALNCSMSEILHPTRPENTAGDPRRQRVDLRMLNVQLRGLLGRIAAAGDASTPTAGASAPIDESLIAEVRDVTERARQVLSAVTASETAGRNPAEHHLSEPVPSRPDRLEPVTP